MFILLALLTDQKKKKVSTRIQNFVKWLPLSLRPTATNTEYQQ